MPVSRNGVVSAFVECDEHRAPETLDGTMGKRRIRETKEPRSEVVTARITPDQRTALEAFCGIEGVSKGLANVVRIIIDAGLEDLEQLMDATRTEGNGGRIAPSTNGLRRSGNGMNGAHDRNEGRDE